MFLIQIFILTVNKNEKSVFKPNIYCFKLFIKILRDLFCHFNLHKYFINSINISYDELAKYMRIIEYVQVYITFYGTKTIKKCFSSNIL